MIIRALVTAAAVALIFVFVAKTARFVLGPYLLPVLIVFTVIVTLSVVRLQQRELMALAKIDTFREQIRQSRIRTRRFLLVVGFAGAIDVLVWWVDVYVASLLGLGLLIFSVAYLISRIPGAIRFGKEQFAEQVKREIDPARYNK